MTRGTYLNEDDDVRRMMMLMPFLWHLKVTLISLKLFTLLVHDNSRCDVTSLSGKKSYFKLENGVILVKISQR